jgi:hypothetical protein
MEGAYKNDIKQLTSLSTFAFTFTIGVRPRGITTESPKDGTIDVPSISTVA